MSSSKYVTFSYFSNYYYLQIKYELSGHCHTISESAINISLLITDHESTMIPGSEGRGREGAEAGARVASRAPGTFNNFNYLNVYLFTSMLHVWPPPPTQPPQRRRPKTRDAESSRAPGMLFLFFCCCCCTNGYFGNK